MPPRRIAYVLGIFPKLSETFIATELAELRRRGVEIRIMSLLPPREAVHHALIAEAGLDRITCYEPARFLGVVREFHPQLLHAHFAREATECARALSQQTGVPFCFTAHGYDIFRKPPADFHQRAAAAAAVVTVSQTNAAYIAQKFGVNPSHLHVIPCGVDTDLFCPDGAPEISSSLPLIVCVARHVEVKNLSLLLEACAILAREQREFRCVLIGDGPLNGELRAQARRLNLESRMEMPGALPQERVLEYWRRACIGVLPSHNEGMPVCLMEAGACGVPVVATRVGGVPELVQDQHTGLLTAPGDAAEFAAALSRLLGDAALRTRLGQAARARVLAQFSVRKQVDALLDVWSHLCQKVAA